VQRERVGLRWIGGRYTLVEEVDAGRGEEGWGVGIARESANKLWSRDCSG